MAKNTDAADVNEIMMAYYLAGKSWSKVHDSANTKVQLNKKKKEVEDDLVDQKDGQAEIQAKEVLAWAKKRGYKGTVKKIWWTARPGVLGKAVGRDVDSSKNPTDVLIQFTSGQFLGVSAKATKTKGDIGFKNPGVGTIDKSLNIKLKDCLDKEEAVIVEKYALPDAKSKRKKYIRDNKKLQEKTQEAGSKILNKIRDKFYDKLKTLPQQKLKDYILSDWMDANDELYPPYIKVTGMGNKKPYTAKVEDPLDNPKLTALNNGRLTLEKIGNDSVGLKANGKKILKMRAKYESEKIASSLKFSGDPWK
jgi:hypothetical protein